MNKRIVIFFCTIFLFSIVSCEVVARFLLYPAECYVCEIRTAEDIWSEKPVWQQDACGAGVVSLSDSCELKSKQMDAECICIRYNRK